MEQKLLDQIMNIMIKKQKYRKKMITTSECCRCRLSELLIQSFRVLLLF